MELLRQSDLRGALELLARVGTAARLDEFAALLVEELPRLIPVDIVSFNEVDPERRRAHFRSNPPETAFPGSEEILARHLEQNPLITHYARTHDGTARTWSDFISLRQLHTTDLYDLLFQPLAVERQMVATLPSTPPLLLGIVLMRRRRDFSERDRALLNLLRPHLARTHDDVASREALGSVEDALERGGEAVVVLGQLGRAVYSTPNAQALLGRWFGATGDDLPAALADARAEGALRLDRDGAILDARFVDGATPVVVLRERRTRLSAEQLAQLGLTRRESQTLALAASGRTNAQIAVELEITLRTVKKHLERVYEKLGVSTRTAAAALAFQALDPTWSR